MKLGSIRALFFVAAVYDFVLGLAFIAAGERLFNAVGVPLPNHWGYIHFCCLMLMIFGLMFLMIAVRPHANRNLIPYGMLLKVSYIAVTGYYWINGGIPWIFQPFLIIDAVMLLGFAWAYFALVTGRDKK